MPGHTRRPRAASLSVRAPAGDGVGGERLLVVRGLGCGESIVPIIDKKTRFQVPTFRANECSPGKKNLHLRKAGNAATRQQSNMLPQQNIHLRE